MFILNLWYRFRESFWPIPLLMCFFSLLVSFALVFVDYLVAPSLANIAVSKSWLFFVDSEGARVLLSTIAGSTIGVAGVTFSITMVVLTLASSQFGPRLIRSFMKNFGNQVALGTFISTFLYCLVVLRFIHNGEHAFVPHIAVNFAIVLTMGSLIVLIYFFHSVASQIQAEDVIHLVASDFESAITRLLPSEAEAEMRYSKTNKIPTAFAEKSIAIKISKSGHIQMIDYDSLFQLALKHDVIMKLNYRAGHYIHKHKSILLLYSENMQNIAKDEISKKVEESVTVGTRPTVTQDIEFPIKQLVEIAVRALSPGINDPFTVVQCIDALTSGLSRIASQPLPDDMQVDETGNIRLIFSAVTFSGILDSAFNQIRQNARASVAVRIRLLESLARIGEEAELSEDKAHLLRHGKMIYEGSKRDGVLELSDQEDIKDRYELLERVLNEDADPSED